MSEYGRIANGGLVESRRVETSPGDGWLPFKPSQRPSFNPQTQEVVEIAPLIELDGITRQYQVLDLSERRPAPNEVFVAPVPNDGTYVPQEAAMWALKELCLVRGHATAIENALNSLPDPPRTIARNRWENKDTISRNSPIIESMRQMLGWTNAYVDELFVAADALSKS